MAKTAQLTGHTAFAALFPRFFPVIKAFHQTVFRQIVRPDRKAVFSLRANRPLAKSRTFNQDSARRAETCRDFNQGRLSAGQKADASLRTKPARTAETHIALITAKTQHFSYGKVEFFTAAQT